MLRSPLQWLQWEKFYRICHFKQSSIIIEYLTCKAITYKNKIENMLRLGHTLFLRSFVWILGIINLFLTMHKSSEGVTSVTNGWPTRNPLLVAAGHGILFLPFLKVILLELNETKVHCIKSFNAIVDAFIFVGVCLLFIDYTTNTIFCSGSLPFHKNIERFANSLCLTLQCELSLLNDGKRFSYREISLFRVTSHTPLLRNHS